LRGGCSDGSRLRAENRRHAGDAEHQDDFVNPKSHRFDPIIGHRAISASPRPIGNLGITIDIGISPNLREMFCRPISDVTRAKTKSNLNSVFLRGLCVSLREIRIFRFRKGEMLASR
jgi:hypothetical protein